MAAEEEGKNKKELEDALSALSVEEQELKKREEEFKTKEKVSISDLKHIFMIFLIVLNFFKFFFRLCLGMLIQ